MMTLIFIILMIIVFGKMFKLSIKAAWGITKMLFTFIVLPIGLIMLVVWGLINLAVPILVIIGIIALIKSASD